MKRFLLLLLLACGVAHANPVTDLYGALVQDEGPFSIEEVTAQTPSPLLTGYQAKTRKCELLVNTNTFQATGSWAIFQVVHEVGHCKALRAGVTIIGEPNQNDEAIADMFAVAWMMRNMSELLPDALNQLIEHRKIDRMIDQRYNTFTAIQRALRIYPQFPGADPWAFTIKQFQQ